MKSKLGVMKTETEEIKKPKPVTKANFSKHLNVKYNIFQFPFQTNNNELTI